MRYAAIDNQGRATGALYDTRTAEIVAHHAVYEETLTPVADLTNSGTASDPIWEVVPAAISDIRASMIVSRFQARAALRAADLLDQAEAVIAASGDDLMIEAWASSVELRRLSPAILAVAAELGLGDEQVDELFTAAAQITF